ncbi:MAG: NYN domain-containing protein [Thermoanaerobacteraceae bacterium]|nr:NYN domain-containing protein [Thermoanaerobacteraceae bacterium]
MAEYLIVDGYNIINSWPKLIDLSHVSLEAARDKLIEMMSNYQGYVGIKVIIVFDAHYVKGSVEKHIYLNEVEIVYTKEGESADHYIEKLVHRISNNNIVRVATSDWVEQQVVLAGGGVRISALELLKLVEETGKKIDKEIKNNERKNTTTITDRLDPGVYEKLEKMRRNINNA